jgi:hypothetical protein
MDEVRVGETGSDEVYVSLLEAMEQSRHKKKKISLYRPDIGQDLIDVSGFLSGGYWDIWSCVDLGRPTFRVRCAIFL